MEQMQFNCVVVDDELHAAMAIRKVVEKTGLFHVDHVFTDPREALEYVQEGNTDLIFLDVNMRHMNGFQFRERMTQDCYVIITTSYSQYAVTAHDYEAMGYLEKPVTQERYLKAAAKALNYLKREGREKTACWNDMLKIKIGRSNSINFVRFMDILYIESLRNIMRIHTAGSRFDTRQTLASLQEQLPPGMFYQVHRSYVIALHKVRRVFDDTVYLGEYDEPESTNAGVPVGKYYREKFYDKIFPKKST